MTADILERLANSYAVIEKYASLDHKGGVVSDQWMGVLRTIADAKATIIDLRPAKSCPQAGYDQLGESYYCLDCTRQWYGALDYCDDQHCPFDYLKVLPKKAGEKTEKT